MGSARVTVIALVEVELSVRLDPAVYVIVSFVTLVVVIDAITKVQLYVAGPPVTVKPSPTTSL
jgi:hypothetical protein